MRIHFRDFAIGAGSLWLHSPSGQFVGPYSGSGLYGDGDFWSGIVSGDSLTIEYLPDPVAAEEAVPFQIVEISHIWDDAFGGDWEADVQPPIAAPGGARTGREAAKLLADWINVAVRTQSMEQSPAADNPPDTKTARLAKQIQSVERFASLDHPVLKAARQLMPGQPADFRLGPVDAARLFSGDDSFRLEVSENASRVIFTLESVDPDVDVDLYVRFGEDNTVQDRRVVADYASEGITGNERIVITPRSDPPLQAGTYFVSIALFDTGVVADGTLTAEVELDGESPPPISGGPLTPGQPTDFRLGPVDTPALFTGNHSFQLEVSENASRVIFTLESVDPDVDVDLYVRFGEDNTVQDRRVVADYASEGITGNERIGITYRSDPPLQAGTYFVSIALFDTGVVADGTITAEVETDAADCHLDATCYPEWSSSATGVALIVIETSEGGSRGCSGTLLNNRRQDLTPYFLTAAHCVDTEEEARSVIAHWSYQTQTCNGELPDFQSVPRTEGASLLSTTGSRELLDPEGDMTLLRLEGDLPDGVMFQGWDASPQPFGTQVAGIHHPGNRDWGFFKRISFGQIIPDPGFGTSDDVYTIVSWPPGQGYTGPGSSGSALFSSPGTVVGTLSFGDIVENACPTRPLLDAYTNFSVFYPRIRQFIDEEFALDFAHFANGASITSSLVFVNVATHPIRPALYFYDKSGHLIDAESVVDVTGDLEVTEDGALTVQTEMEPLGELTISTHGRGEVVTGSVTVASDGPIGRVLRFDLPGIGVAGVGASQPVRDAIFPARRQAGRISTASAIHNPGEEALGVSCRLMKEGIVLEEVEIPLAANGQEARFIQEVFTQEVFTLADTSDFVGSVRCTAPGLFTGVAVELDAGNRIFTTLPVVPVDQTGGSNKETALDFAHFANGASITSSLVFVNVATHPIRPALYFYDKSGHLIDAESVVDVTGDLEVTEDGALTVQTEMEPLGELTISTHGRGEVVTGSVTVASDGPIGRVLRFDLPGIGVAGVGASQPVRDAIFPARRQAGRISTASAIHNPGEEALGVSCRLMKEGIVLEEVEIPLAANGQEARFIQEVFTQEVFTLADTSDFVGSVRCTAPGLFTGVAVELDAGNRIFTTLPVVPVDQTGGSNKETALDFAHFANGASITSSLVFVNVATHPIRPALYFYDKSGHLIDAESVVDVTGDLEVTEDGALTVQTEMEPLGELTISTHGRGEVVTGSVTVASDGPIGGVLRFDLPGIGVAGVGASQPVRDAIFPARRQAGRISTASAIHNPGEEALGVSCRLMKEGIVLEEVEIPLAANGQEARFIQEVFTLADTSDFVGSVRCTAPGLFTGVAVELDAGNRIFTTLPVVPVIQGEINMETPASAPDLVVQTPSVSDSSPNAGESFTLSTTVRNQGNGGAALTTLRYYRSADATISMGDTQVGTDAVSGLSVSGASDESVNLTAPSTAGTYYYGACVDPVSGESDTGNNCSSAVRVTVSDSPMEMAGTRYEVDDVITTFPTGVWFPDVIRGGVAFSFSGGNAVIAFNNGGYIEEGGFRYTCETTGGCEVRNRVVRAGTIVETSI